MVWNINDSAGFESAKIAAIAVHYLQGERVLDLGCGDNPVWPSVIGIDNHSTHANARGIQADIRDLSLFTDGSIDAVFSSHAVEDFPEAEVPALLAEWWRVLRPGGHLVLYLPHPDLYPHIGEEGCNPAHQWEPTPDRIIDIMKGVGSWTLLENEVRGGTNEYSFFQVFKKNAEAGHRFEVWQRNPGGKQRALVIRLGAIGDAIQTSSIFPLLQAQGFDVTVNCMPSTYDVLKHDPHVDGWLVQGKDFVPNHELGPYWESLRERYDLIINLCESIEGSLLAMEGRLQHGYSDEARRRLSGNVSYLARTHDIAGVPHNFNPRFYPNNGEVRWAKALKKAYTSNMAPIVLIALAGSSLHKIYPHHVSTIKWLLQRTQVHIVLTGDREIGVALQDALADTSHYPGLDTARLHPMAGKWSIRQTLAFAQQCEVVVGPETGVLNAVSYEPDVAKVLILSHSSRANIGGEWLNTITLAADRALAPCYPCHRLHNDWRFCPQSAETNAALCASVIPAEAVFNAIMRGLANPPAVADTALVQP